MTQRKLTGKSSEILPLLSQTAINVPPVSTSLRLLGDELSSDIKLDAAKT